jgi:hypothetical protein
MNGDPSQPDRPPGVRASDADRERTVELLRRHHQDGRLTTEELAERSERAYSAMTFDELDAVMTDLPPPAAAPAPAPAAAGPAPGGAPRRQERPGARQGFYRMLWTFVLIDMFMIGVWAFSGAGTFWPIWVILGSGVAIGFSAINTFAPRDRTGD